MVAEVLDGGAGELVCCGQPMRRLETPDAERLAPTHRPVVEPTDEGTRVVVGSSAHPMTEAHRIQWIEAACGERTECVFLDPGDPPEAEFTLSGEQIVVRAMCNKHGLWTTSAAADGRGDNDDSDATKDQAGLR